MKKPAKLEPSEAVDANNPEWTKDDFLRAKSAKDVLPQLFNPDVSKTLLKPRGRPLATVTKERINIRLSADVLSAFRLAGPGWQTRIDTALKDWVKQHSAN